MKTNTIELFFKDEIKTSLALVLSPLLSTVWYPFSIIIPLLIWIQFKDQYKLVHFYAKEMFNFTLNFLLLSMIPIGLIFITPFAYTLFIILGVFSLVAQGFYIYNCYNGKSFHFPYTIRFIKGL